MSGEINRKDEIDWWQFMNEYRIAICIVLTLVALLFIIFGHCYREEVQSKLKAEFFKFPACSIDWWSVSHLVLYAIFGFLIPGYPLTFLMIGAGFEILEDGLSSDGTTQLVDCMNSRNKQKNIMCQGSINDDYWYMNPSDVWVNLIGYVIGSAVRTTFFGM